MNSRIPAFDALPVLNGRGLPGLPDPDSVDVRGLARAFWRRRWFILAWALGLGLAVYALVSQLAPTYTATAKVILDTRKAQIITANEVVADIDPTEQIVNGEISVLRSNLLLGDVVATLGFDRLRAIDPMEAPPSFTDRAKAALLDLAGLSGRGTPEADGGTGLMSDEEIHTQRLIGAIRRAMSVFSEADSYVIVVRIETVSPELAMVLANTIAERYIRLQLDGRRDAVEQATAWLEERVAELRADVEAAEAAVARFQAESLLRDGGTIDNTSQQLAEISSQLAAARAARLEAEARYTQLMKVVDEQGLEAAAATVSTPTIEVLRAQLLDLRQQDAVWAESYDESQPRRAKLIREMEQLRADIAAEIGNVLATRQSELEVARIRENSLRENVLELEARVMSITQNRLGLRQLEREASAARQTYETLLARMTETRTQKQLQQPDAKLIEQAVLPAVPSAPRPKLLAALGLALGGILAAALVFFNELTAVTFRTSHEVESATGLPVVTSLPLGNWRNTRKGLNMLRANPYGVYGERVRQLRTVMMTQGRADRPQSAMLLSSAPDEGKTMTTLALATMTALAGKSVVVVDADLRRSSIRKVLGLKLKHDFADFVEGKCTLGDTIVTCGDLGFDVIASRGGRHKATEEFAASWLEPMLEDLKQVYDLVLIDAPALLAVSDAMVLAPLVDHRFYVVGYDATPRGAVLDGLGVMRDLRLPIDGAIFNKVDVRRSPDAYAGGYSYDA